VTHRKAVIFPSWLVGAVAAGDASHAAIRAGAGATHSATAPAFPRSASAEDEQERDRESFRKLLAHLAEQVRQQHTQERPPLDALRILAVELGVAIAARLVHEAIAADAYGIESLVRGAIERLHGKHAATVHLHPDDLALLERRLGGDHVALHADMPVQFRADANLGRGSCKVQAGDVSVWASLQKQLWEIRERLLEGLPLGEPTQ
jgi:flagellar biosynthesis/type III secretory pathway protein FliH